MSDAFEWLDWLEPSGPFLAAPVLGQVFGDHIHQLDPIKRKIVRQAYDEYRQALDEEDPESSKFHTAWIAVRFQFLPYVNASPVPHPIPYHRFLGPTASDL